MISVLVLCGLIFIVSVGVIVGSYVQSDIDFLLTATADSMESGISYCSEVVTKVRKSDILMDYLIELKDDSLSEEEKEELKREFEKQVSISSQSILGTGIAPLVEKAYLFDNEGKYLNTTYYAMTYSEIAKSNRAFEEIYARHQKEMSMIKDYGFYPLDEDSFCLLFPILDDRMDLAGSILYQIEYSALEYIMADMMKYEGAFWKICDDEDGRVVFGQNMETSINEEEYQVHKRNIGMNLELFVGIPQNQFFTLLYDSTVRTSVPLLMTATKRLAARFATTK